MLKQMNYSLFFGLVFLVACGNDAESDETQSNLSGIPAPTSITYNLVKDYPHDTSSFTQGLIFYKGNMYESTGNPNNAVNNGSWVGPVDLNTGKQTKKVTLPADIFGEGITILNDKVYQITWQNNKGFVYDLATFRKLKEFNYNHEGWGITNNGKELIVSDGSSNLYFWDPETLKEIRRISIQDNNGLRNNINELEFINGAVYANVWETNEILKIDPANGNVTGKLDMSSLKQSYPELEGANASEKVLNGIAWDSSGNRLFVTGKNWSKLFELKLLN
ncbi:glutaminyl-peptide cyclotransferase [Lacibacter sediminis]|uniref:Glutaminyl-peptide cyclotransferase n=1 Tax=Lacibacter sediminis TaxID=2760713 RepID=A0A7G5XDN2_9BACT|nr:glutaminyl-peptide cyclotransferase [Lacibacter sediminis]QNA43585.1 glutaminyl-peptide cyclotransferase [Lacibacter sediminis]